MGVVQVCCGGQFGGAGLTGSRGQGGVSALLAGQMTSLR